MLRRILIVCGALAFSLLAIAVVLGVHDMASFGCGGHPLGPPSAGLSDRLARGTGCATLRLTHRGRKSANAYEVTIWFVVDGEAIYLTTMDTSRQWVRNVAQTPQVQLQIGPERFEGTVAPVLDPTERRREYELLVRKYWFVRLMDAALRLTRRDARANFDLGRGGFFRVRDLSPVEGPA